MTPSGYLSVTSVTLVAVLSAAVGIWSGLSGPDVADVQVHQAAANLAAAPGFVVTLRQTESELGTAEQVHIEEVVHYQAPDRQTAIETISSNQSKSVKTITQIGSSCWIHTTGTAAAFPCTRDETGNLLSFVRTLDKASQVTNDGGTYLLSAKDSQEVISSETAGQFAFGMAKVGVRITGAYISWEHLSLDAAVQGASILIDEVVTFSQVGIGRSIVAPAGSPTETASG